MSAWQPIETAPKDQRVLIWTGYERYIAHWAQHPVTGHVAWIIATFGEDEQLLAEPTHWSPIIEPPEEDGSE